MDDNFAESLNNGVEQTSATVTRTKEEIMNQLNEISRKVADFGRETARRIDAQRESTAKVLDKTAATIHDQGEKLSNVTHATADKIKSTADYVRENDAVAMAGDIGGLIQRYPGQAVLVGILLGFLAGRFFFIRD